jgi:hypothetical protein
MPRDGMIDALPDAGVKRMSELIQHRSFYHSFPRRGASSDSEIEKGKKILTAIRDFGLVLTPQYIEWSQPNLGDQPRVLPILQRRVCFTELSPRELPGHADKFGHFSLEFEIDTVRRLGAMPVFYVPQPTSEATDGSHVGAALVAIATDLRAVVQRMASLSEILHGPTPVNPKFNLNTGFTGSPDGRANFTLNRDETKNFLAAIGHAVTPWSDLRAGADALLNFFHPTDNRKIDKILEYYREREWRVACGLRLKGRDGQLDVDLLRALSPQERHRLLEIDQEFFSRRIRTETGEADTLDQALVLPGLHSQSVMQMVRRVIVPSDVVKDTIGLLTAMNSPPQVVSLDEVGGPM